LAILFNNQGLVKNEFRAGLALVRVVESTVTAIVYFHLGLFVAESQDLLSVIMPSVVVGIPVGAYVIRKLDAETFRRICMSFDAWIVGFGLSRVLIELNLMESPWAYSVMAVTILIDVCLLYIFFTKRSTASMRSHAVRSTLAASDRSGAHDYITSGMMDPADDPFRGVGSLLGYVIGMLGIAMVVYSIWPEIFPPMRLPP
jgi:uncharacterized membrane protein YfcA